MSAQHIQGPWVCTGTVVYDELGDRIADCDFGVEGDEQRARLIAAAPTMAATLHRAAHVLAEIADRISGDDRKRLDALRLQIVDDIKQATPEYYGGAA